ncbi:hypothetical protein HHK36_023728 [Tetracentron sinense]|uniref:FBD domain-containing protein n=1 Tax=Tetracentron sinense TaxID=13715 RepID=A0A835D5N1_TETSI|nr:hypothetical protein HHK36_023728 [Tetracentron sinense]
MGLPRLKYLCLRSITFMDEKPINDLISSCALLERLELIGCRFYYVKNLNISTPQLMILFIDTCLNDYSEFKIKLSAPKLRALRCRNYMTVEYSIENLSSLVVAWFEMKIGEDGKPDLFLNRKEEYGRRMIKLVGEICNARTITLTPWLLQFVAETPAALLRLPTQFHNLRHLKLFTFCTSASICLTIFLLKRSPCLNKLVLEITNEAELPSDSVLCCLKSVELRNFQGCENELNLLKFLLKKCIGLGEDDHHFYKMANPYGEKHVTIQ